MTHHEKVPSAPKAATPKDTGVGKTCPDCGKTIEKDQKWEEKDGKFYHSPRKYKEEKRAVVCEFC